MFEVAATLDYDPMTNKDYPTSSSLQLGLASYPGAGTKDSVD